MEITSILALVVFLGFVYWFSSTSEERVAKKKLRQTQADLISLADELNVSGITEDLVVWLDQEIRLRTGRAGIDTLADALYELTDNGEKQQAVVQLMLIQQRYLEAEKSAAEREQWYSYVETFQKMNKAQQAHQIKRMKEAARPGSAEDSEKINSLELIHLGNDSKTTDVVVGGVTIFTLKSK